MSQTLSLNRRYGSFFWECTKFAASPYTKTFMSIAGINDRNENARFENITAAAIICGVLTFVVPVLPTIASFTTSLASIAILLAVASMFVTYPVALVMDACDLSNPLQPVTSRYTSSN